MSEQILEQQLEVSDVKVLDFKDNTLPINLSILKRTYKESNFNGQSQNPTGLYHTDVIERIMKMCDTHGLSYEIQSMFAAHNKQKNADGVSISQPLEEQYGTKAVEAHVLRRVYTTIQINDMADDETTTGLVIAYHQNGIQIAIGPNVRMCTNQCILSPERMLTTYGDNRIKDSEKIFQIVDDWIVNFKVQREQDMNVINKMKSIRTSYDDIMKLIGYMNAIRVTKDTSNKLIKGSELAKSKQYPLNQGQISEFTENYLEACIKNGNTEMSLWEVYNIATELYKPGETEIPNIVSQNISWAEMLTSHFSL